MTDFYVSPTGDDAHLGRLADPADAFRTLERAQQAMRASPGDDTVFIRAGVYTLDAPLSLSAADAGSSFVAYAEERPIISGGAAVTGWQVGADDVWTAQVGGTSDVRQLTVDGVAQTEARFPNYDAADPVRGGWLWAEALPNGRDPLRELAYDKAQLSASQLAPGGRVTVFAEVGYSSDSLVISSVDTTNGIIQFAMDATYEIGPASRFFVSSSEPQLDQPGEWWFDTASRTLSYKALAGFNGIGTAVAAGDKTLVEIGGTRDITLRGLTFTDAATTEQTDDVATAAVVIADSSNVTVDGNHFINVAMGVLVEDEGHHNTISSNDFTDIGGSAIELSPASHENIVTNNTVSHAGTLFRGAAGINLGETWGNTVSHNRIQDVPQSGISEGHFSSALKSGGNTYEYNEVLRSGQETSDTGAIYIYSGEDAAVLGSTIRYNKIVDTGGVSTVAGAFVQGRSFSWGIYLDDFTSNAQVYGNFVSGTALGGVNVHGGSYNTIYNNILLDNLEIGLHVQEIDRPMLGNDFYHNIVQVPIGERIVSSDDRFINPASFHDNIYYNPNNLIPEHSDYPYETWRNLGGDRGSDVAASVGFVNAAAGDYSFAPDSFASTQGIQQLPFDLIGPTTARAPAPVPASAPVSAGATPMADPDGLIGDAGAGTLASAGVSAGAAALSMPDEVVDFSLGIDHIELPHLSFDAADGSVDLKAGSLATQSEQLVRDMTGEATQSQYAQPIYETDTGKLWWNPDGRGDRADTIAVTFLDAPRILVTDMFWV